MAEVIETMELDYCATQLTALVTANAQIGKRFLGCTETGPAIAALREQRINLIEMLKVLGEFEDELLRQDKEAGDGQNAAVPRP